MTSPPREIVTETELREELSRDRFLLFKHSQTCPISAEAFRAYRQFCEQAAGGGVATAWLDVRARRVLSQWVAGDSGIRHQSPQAILFVVGHPVWHASHHAITKDALDAAIARASP